jgi:DNA polymerase
MTSVTIDFETASASDLRATGVYRYAEDPTTRIWMLSYRFDERPVQRWHPGEAAPAELLEHVRQGRRVVAHNSGFERVVWNTVLQCRMNPDWPRLEIAQQDDTMARALAIHLPASLGELAAVLGLAERKDKEGHTLMMRMSRPRKQRPGAVGLAWHDEPEKIARLGDYCDQDVIVECFVDAKLPPLSPDERELWERDQTINDRGVMLDVRTIQAAVAVREVAKQQADVRICQLTNGFAKKITEALKIVEWLQSRGLPCESIAKECHGELIAFAQVIGDEDAVKVLRLRSDSSKTSTAKYDKMLSTVCADGRARGLFSYHRALTGRWGGFSIQPQNLPRVDEDRDMPDVIAALKIMEMFE